jgi:hypothetical protein
MELTDPGTYKSSNKVPRSSPGKSSCLQVLGIIPGEDFAPSTLTPEQLHAVNEGVHPGSAMLRASLTSRTRSNRAGHLHP